MTDDLELKILLSAQDRASSVISKLATGLGPVGMVAVGVGAAILGIGATSVKMAGDYQQSMLKVQALAGLSAQQVQQFSDQILKLAPQVGQSPLKLADSLYFLASAGVPANQMMNTMRLSAEMAATGNFDVKISADALTSSINSLGLSYSQAGNIADEMTATVTAGKMEMSDYAKVAGQVATGVKVLANSHDSLNHAFQEGNAALATFTQMNGKTQLDSTRLNMLFLQLGVNTDKMAKNFDKMTGTTGGSKAWNETVKTSEILNGHIYTVTNTIHHAAVAGHALGGGFDVAKFSTMDLADKIKYLNDITSRHHETQQQQQAELLKIFSGNTRVLQTYDNLRDSLGTYEKNLKSIQDSEKNGQTTTDKFKVTQEGFNQKMREARAALDVVFIKIGTDLLPVLEKFLNVYVIPLITKFSDWITQSGFLKAAAQDLSDALNWLGQLVGGLATGVGDVVGWFQQAGPQGDILKTALIGIGIAIAGVKIKDFIGDLATFATDTIPNKVIPAIAQMTGSQGLLGIKTAAQGASGADGIGSIGTAMDTAAATAKSDFAAMGEDILGVLGPIAVLTIAAGQIWQKIAPKAPFPNAPTPLGPNGPNLPINPGGGNRGPGWGKAPGANIPGFASGIENFPGGLAYVHQGELLVNMPRGTSVIPAGRSGSAGGHTFNITINAPSGDGPDIATTVRYAIADMMRSYTPLPNITSGGRL